MHIAFLNPQGNFDRHDSHMVEHPDFGGQLVYVRELCMALARASVRVDIITRRIDDPDWPEFEEPLAYYADYPDNPRIVRIDCGGPMFLNKEELWDHLDEFTTNIATFYGDALPDFLATHYGDGGYCGVLLRKKLGLGFTFTGHSLGAQKLDKLGMSVDNFDDMDKQFHFSRRIMAERLAMQHATNIITSTRQERFEQYSHALYSSAVDPADGGKFLTVPPGVNTRVFTTVPGSEDSTVHARIDAVLGGQDNPAIVLANRLDEKKNLAGVFEAYAGNSDLQARALLAVGIRGIDDPYRDISGLPDSERQVLQPLLELVDTAGISDRVHFITLNSQEELASAYRYFAERRSVFALTAFYEPFGLASIEAAACGLAVVATCNGGPTEIFQDGSGILVDPFNAVDIADGLLRALDDFDDLSEKGRQRVETMYTWDRTAQGYLAAIQDCMTAGAGTAVTDTALDGKQRLLDYLAA